ncbi:hypothetical protein [Pseudomonas moorei]|uniref:hypothetical protein n=1 Tax=Pseudomonas moorei TaxID=395599 RepID=UPI0036F2870F
MTRARSQDQEAEADRLAGEHATLRDWAIVDASILAGYQAVAGNELQDGVSYPILIVLDPSILTSPVKV